MSLYILFMTVLSSGVATWVAEGGSILALKKYTFSRVAFNAKKLFLDGKSKIGKFLPTLEGFPPLAPSWH